MSMKTTKKMQKILERMMNIDRMERGKLCQLTGKAHFNHQTWQNGKNEVRYVSRNNADELKKDIDGYQLFMKLAEQYADEIIKKTRREREMKKRNKKTES